MHIITKTALGDPAKVVDTKEQSLWQSIFTAHKEQILKVTILRILQINFIYILGIMWYGVLHFNFILLIKFKILAELRLRAVSLLL